MNNRFLASSTDMTAKDVIAMLGLQPHTEGGHFREMFRDEKGEGARAFSTAIYYLLRAGEVSRWHRVDAAEVWHWYPGAPLALAQSADGVGISTETVGNDISAGQKPQPAASAQTWQSARSLCVWTLVGCTVAPVSCLTGLSSRRPAGSREPDLRFLLSRDTTARKTGAEPTKAQPRIAQVSAVKIPGEQA